MSLQQLAEKCMDIAAVMPLRFTWRLAEGLGRLWFRLDTRHRFIALNNLRLAWGNDLTEKERRNLAQKNFIHLAKVILELPYIRMLTPDKLDGFVAFDGLEHLDAALKKGRGVLVMASHFGNWELMALAFSLLHHPINIVIRPLDNPFLDSLIDNIRTRGGNKMIAKKGSISKVLRLLAAGEVVGLLIDQNPAWHEGVFVPFFNEIACTNKALSSLALRTGAPVIPAYNVREPDGSYRIIFEPEVVLDRSGDTRVDIEENTATFNRIIENYVRRHPEQWFWVHQRWKTRPHEPWPRER
jgi:Kdo2-lipid IVA lauroyltransferase/acyltransferase